MDGKTTAAIERLKADPNLARSLMGGRDGQALLRLLTGADNGAALQRATQAAAGGDTRELARMLGNLMKDKDAAAIMSRLNESAKR